MSFDAAACDAGFRPRVLPYMVVAAHRDVRSGDQPAERMARRTPRDTGHIDPKETHVYIGIGTLILIIILLIILL